MLADLSPHLNGADQILVFGGPYSNLQATLAMRADAERRGIPAEHILCTGDIVAYCANPVETIAEIRDWGIHVIAGNCEQQLASGADNCACGFDEGSACDVLAKGWYGYADQRVGRDDRLWMGQLTDEALFDWAGFRFRVVHGGCGATSQFIFPSQHDVIASQLTRANADIVIAGHSGIPFGQSINAQFWFNAGVLGQPANDGTTDAWYGLLTRTPNGITASLHRLAYDVPTARAAVLDAGYANPYGLTLGSGLWPNQDILPPTEVDATGTPLEEVSFEIPRTSRIRERAA